MPYSTTGPNIEEARLLALQLLIQAKVANLDASCSRDLLTPVGTFTAANIVIGMPHSVPKESELAAWISVVGGSTAAPADLSVVPEYIGLAANTDYATTIQTHIFGFVHNQLFANTGTAWANIIAQARSRELLRARMADYLRADVFNAGGTYDTVLTSTEYTATGDLLRGCITAGSKFLGELMPGSNSYFYALHLVHTGAIE